MSKLRGSWAVDEVRDKQDRQFYDDSHRNVAARRTNHRVTQIYNHAASMKRVSNFWYSVVVSLTIN